ncbi:synaptophysin-like isoform X4 [Ciconia boyciana]|uniref:synaptophysin-like isoform X4 n=1 Tax=Ciconia boyciana TaxID=52775 RepID=UPI003BA1E0D5
MEVLNQLVAGAQFRVIKEPLGFLKLLEWLFSIFAFATCGGYAGSFRLSVQCPSPNRSAPAVPVSFGYPFRLHRVYFEAPSCGGGPPERVFLDLGLTALLAFLWLVSSCAWAAALADVKAATAPAGVLAQVGGCQRPGVRCRAQGGPRTSGLNTSVVFGFLNLVLWTGNIWFVFKETGWGGLGARAPPGGAPEKAPAPEGGYGQPEAGYGQPGGGYGQPGGYQPDYGQGGYGPPEGGYGQGAPTSFANQM